MIKNRDKPAWWPKNPYGTTKEWLRKSDHEQAWEEASDDCYEAWSKAMKEMWEKYKIVGNPK